MYRIIVNPIAGKGNATRATPQVEAYLNENGCAFETFYTKAPGHATELAFQTTEREDMDGVISMGGDGTVREIACALTGKEVPLLIVPCGTGNDLAKSMCIPKKPLDALKWQLNGHLSAIDVGSVNGHVFVNTSGTGLDVDVLKNTLEYKKRYKGLLPYLLGIFAAIKAHKPVELELSVKDAVIRKKMTIIEVSNGQYIGGGMRVAPTADLRDGHFDIYYVDALPRPIIMLILPFFLFGWYRIFPFAHVVYADALTIKGSGLTINIDGDLVELNKAVYRLSPNGLKTRAK